MAVDSWRRSQGLKEGWNGGRWRTEEAGLHGMDSEVSREGGARRRQGTADWRRWGPDLLGCWASGVEGGVLSAETDGSASEGCGRADRVAWRCRTGRWLSNGPEQAEGGADLSRRGSWPDGCSDLTERGGRMAGGGANGAMPTVGRTGGGLDGWRRSSEKGCSGRRRRRMEWGCSGGRRTSARDVAAREDGRQILQSTVW